MRLLLIFLLLKLCSPLYGQIVSFENYFPLKEGEKKVYRIFNLTKTGKTLMQDSIVTICQSRVVDGQKVFYFRRDVFPDDSGYAAVIPALYYAFFYKDENLMTLPVLFTSKLDTTELKYFLQEYPKQVKLKKTYFNRSEDSTKRYRFEGFENIKIHGKLFKNCLKLTIISSYYKYTYRKTIWFKKGFGMIKFLEKGEIGQLWEIRL